MRKGKEGSNGKDPRPEGRTVMEAVEQRRAGAAAASEAKPAPRETIFGETRSGRDRREDAAQADDSRRVAGTDRRQNKAAQPAWWLHRDYVESHHFVQKTTRPRGRRGDTNEPEE